MTTLAPPMSRPQKNEYAEYYDTYVKLVLENEIIELLGGQGQEVVAFLRSISEAQSEVVHPPYSWTIKQVINHMIDGERIFAYRLLRIARGDTTPLPGFDENEFAKAGKVDRLKLADLVDEFATVRAATLSLLRNLPDEAWPRLNTANNHPISVRALAWIMAGHVRHHLAIMRKRLEHV